MLCCASLAFVCLFVCLFVLFVHSSIHSFVCLFVCLCIYSLIDLCMQQFIEVTLWGLSSWVAGTILGSPVPQSMRQTSPPRSSRSMRTAPWAAFSPRKLIAALHAACSEPHKTNPDSGYMATEMVWPRAATHSCLPTSREELHEAEGALCVVEEHTDSLEEVLIEEAFNRLLYHV